MKVCLIGEHEDVPDEGMKKTAQKYSKYLKRNGNDVLEINPKKLVNPKTWLKIRSFEPDIIHYVPGPSIFSFMLTTVTKSFTSNSKVVHSCLHHAFQEGNHSTSYSLSYNLRFLLPLLKPDLLLVQSEESKQFFEQYQISCEYLFTGVDLDKFTPVDNPEKRALRNKYGLKTDKTIILHVGSIKPTRNIRKLKYLNAKDTKVVIVGSTATERDEKLKKDLEKSGIIVLHEYIENIEEMYMMADYYVFPTTDPIGCCEIPLSILEAMSCNLPVLTTKFGGLEEMFEGGKGFIFLEDLSKDLGNLDINKENNVWANTCNTREMVNKYDWESITNNLGEKYQEILL